MGKLVTPCCSRCAHPGPVLQLEERTSFHVAIELEHVESVDLRSAIRKADAFLPAFMQHIPLSEADIHLQTGRLSRVVPLITVS